MNNIKEHAEKMLSRLTVNDRRILNAYTILLTGLDKKQIEQIHAAAYNAAQGSHPECAIELFLPAVLEDNQDAWGVIRATARQKVRAAK